MKKRLLLMFIAGVCLSPTIVFATDSTVGYVGKSPTVFTKVDGVTVSEKGNSGTVGPFERLQRSPGSVPGGESVCNWANARKELADEHAQKLEPQQPGKTKADSAS